MRLGTIDFPVRLCRDCGLSLRWNGDQLLEHYSGSAEAFEGRWWCGAADGNKISLGEARKLNLGASKAGFV